jgi:hypothetical protein
LIEFDFSNGERLGRQPLQNYFERFPLDQNPSSPSDVTTIRRLSPTPGKQGKAKADAETAARRAADAQVVADAERLIAAWNERQARRMPFGVRADDRRRARKPAPFPMGLLPSLPHHAGR